MKSVLSSTVLVCSFLLALPAMADAYTPTLHSEYQAVTGDDPKGDPAWPLSGSPYPIQLLGVVINNPEDMSDYGVYSSDMDDPTWWQTYIQALPAGVYGGQTVAPNDYGGTALYMRVRHPWIESASFYSDSGWAAEMERLNYPTDVGTGEPVTTPLKYGDVIMVQAKAPGLFFRGKYNINEQHNVDTSKDFYITILQRDTTPTVASPDDFTLADLKDASDNFIFNEDRLAGCEHYQASLVSLDSLLLVDAANWALDGTVMVKQTVEGIERTFPMKLGLDDDLASIDAELLETTPFSVTAILDQEDYDAPYTGGYRLWLTNASNLTVVPEPGSLALLVAGGLAALLLWRRRS
ncbi:MAG: PEP-CTERM sorting domain-containing protein [Pirellulales bacterium]|nr:PEP-CTERM sorting domain-containing protein [Pirellulales bacterium]